MFDQQTIDLIRSAPPLPGLDLEDLPKELTRVYSTIVALRMRMRAAVDAATYEEALGEAERQLWKIAMAQEALVAVATDLPNRAAAAFVAASAHQLRFSARALQTSDEQPSRLRPEAIAPEIAATVLFLIAGRPAEAAQMSRGIRFSGDETIEDELRAAIVNLAHGRLADIISRDLPASEADPMQLFWRRVLLGIRQLSSDLVGQDRETEQTASAAETFETVRNLSVEPVAIDGTIGAFSTFAGPHHLASLLALASADLLAAGVINVQAPPSIPAAEWRAFTQRVAVRRPYLWPNHRDAIRSGCLSVGTSAVLSFPTGAGKSTLAEMKIASTRLSGRKVIFLAPTLALVNQVTAEIRYTFPEAEATLADDLEPEELKSISVMTPERCLTMLAFSPDVFKDVGLLVFDECHLMHPKEREGSTRRSIDAMLCLLAFLRNVPETDVLLISAMISNAEELAAWIQDLTGRTAVAQTLSWKPTRQAKGCVVYPSDQIKKLNKLIAPEAHKNQQSIAADVKRQLRATPHGMFSLFQTWKTTNVEDYALLDLLGEDVKIEAAKSKYSRNGSKSVYLTPNRNGVAGAIAARSADAGIKTLVFAQTIPFCTSIQKQAQEAMRPRTVMFNNEEAESYELAVMELGGAAHSYCTPGSLAGCHHGALLPVERQVIESLFKRSDGMNLLVATSTLAQGMNLPGQLVVIAGDDRFDVELNRMELLETHELLNAAGRAGRAGQAAEGMVILVPGKVVAYDVQSHTITEHWMELQRIFSNSDQCLALEDPLEAILDRIHDASSLDRSDDSYLLRRLPIKITEGTDSARSLLASSFAAFRKQTAGDHEWIAARIEAALSQRQQLCGSEEDFSWEHELAAATGVLRAHDIRSLATKLKATTDEPLGDVKMWVGWGLSWLEENPAAMADIFRPVTIKSVFGASYEEYAASTDCALALLATIRKSIPLWLEGAPLNQLDRLLTGTEPKKCDAAREWAFRLAPELGYFFGIVTQTYKMMMTAEDGEAPDLPISFLKLPRCIREGFDTPSKLALHQAMGAVVPRVEVHRTWREIQFDVDVLGDYEKWQDVVQTIKQALNRYRKGQ